MRHTYPHLVSHSYLAPEAIAPKIEFAETSETRSRAVVVCIGSDPMLLYTRGRILSSAGYEVIVGHPDLIVSRLPSLSPALVIFCHTLLQAEASAIAAELRLRCPSSKALLLVEMSNEEYDPDLFSGTLRSLDGPLALLGAAVRLLGPDRASH